MTRRFYIGRASNMDIIDNPIELVSFTSLILLLLLNVHRSLQVFINDKAEEDNATEDIVEGLD